MTFDPGRPASRKSRLFAVGLGVTMRPALALVRHSGPLLSLTRPVIDELASHQSTARGITISKLRSNGIHGLWLDNDSAGDAGRVILYLHGGGFISCSPQTHKGLVSELCREADASALVLDYRLAPRHPFPAAADDALTAYQMLLSRGYAPSDITLAGDSAGGHLISRLLGDLDERGLPMPAGALLMSPFLDLTAKQAMRRDKEQRDPFVPARTAMWAGQAYAGKLRSSDRHLDVIAQDKRRWPPVLIQVGETECLLPDSERLADSLAKAGVSVELQIWPGQVHVFQALGHFVPESRPAVREAGAFLQSVSGQDASVRSA